MRRVINIVMLLLWWLQFAGAIDISNIFHNPNDIFYVNPSAGEIKLKTKRANLTGAELVFTSSTTQMVLAFEDEEFDYFVAYLNNLDTTQSYYFVLKDNKDTLKFPLSGEFRTNIGLFLIPSWAMGKIYYSIYPDGFYNGDLTNDPKDVLTWGTKPEDWHSYGGDLKGIISKI